MRKFTIEEYVANAKKLQEALKNAGIENVVINIGVSEIESLMQDRYGYEDAVEEVKRQTRLAIEQLGAEVNHKHKNVLMPYKVAMNMGIIKEIWDREGFNMEFGVEVVKMAWTRWVKDTPSSYEYKASETRKLEHIYGKFDRLE